jgi:hypothetical protein
MKDIKKPFSTNVDSELTNVDSELTNVDSLLSCS